MSPISWSPSRTEPVAGTKPPMAFMRVDLPAPLLPMSPTISRSLTLTVTPSTATFPPKVTRRSDDGERRHAGLAVFGLGQGHRGGRPAPSVATSLPNRRSAQAKMASRTS